MNVLHANVNEFPETLNIGTVVKRVTKLHLTVIPLFFHSSAQTPNLDAQGGRNEETILSE